MKKPSLAKLAGVLGIAFAAAAMPANEAAAHHSSCNAPQPDSSLVIDLDTGVILESDNAGAQRIPASLTKMMTLLLVMEALDSGQIKESDMITISQHAVSGQLWDNRTPVRAGDQISVREAISGLVTLSSNKIAIAIAEHVAGSEDSFVDMMNDRARSIGMDDTIFVDPHGLDDTRQTTTAFDMVRLVRHMINNHDSRLHYFNTGTFSHRGVTRHGGSSFTNAYRDVDLAKTGYVCKSGFNLVATSERNGRTIVGVVFGRHTGWQRNHDLREILDEAHRNARRIISVANMPNANPSTRLE